MTLVEGRAEALPFDDASVDGLTCTYLLRYVDDPQATSRGLVRIVKPGGPIAYLDFGCRRAARCAALWDVYTGVGLPAPAGSCRRPGTTSAASCGPSIRRFCARTTARAGRRSRTPGVGDVEVRRMSLGGGVVVWGRRDAG